MDIRVVSFRELPNNNFELEVSLLYAQPISKKFILTNNAEDTSVSVGRNEQVNKIVILDQAVSSIHGRFFVRNSKLFYEDNDSTNGSFKKYEKNQGLEVQDNMEFKIGEQYLSCSVELDYLNAQQPSTLPENQCIICRTSRINTTFSPCKHSIVCQLCASEIILKYKNSCPICRCPINNFYMIYN